MEKRWVNSGFYSQIHLALLLARGTESPFCGDLFRVGTGCESPRDIENMIVIFGPFQNDSHRRGGLLPPVRKERRDFIERLCVLRGLGVEISGLPGNRL